MNLFVVLMILLSAAAALAGVTFAVYASMPKKFLEYASAGRFAGLAPSCAAKRVVTHDPSHLNPLLDQPV